MKFHDAIRKHIKVLDGIQKRLRTKDESFTSVRLENFYRKIISLSKKDLKIMAEENGVNPNQIDTGIISDLMDKGFTTKEQEIWIKEFKR